MSNLRFAFVITFGILTSCGVETAQAQFYGNGFSYGGFGGYGGYGGYNGFGAYNGYNGFGYNGFGPNIGAFAPPIGFYNVPSQLPGGALGGYGVNNSSATYGYAAPGPVGTMANGSPYNGYPGFGWWPLSASDVKVTAIPVPNAQGSSSFMRSYADGGQVAQQQPQASVPQSQPVTHRGETIKLTCPKATTQPLSYFLNGYPYTIQPGYSQTFLDDRVWRLEFRRGDASSELVAYTLKPGKFNFAIGSSGWELREVVGVQPGNDLPPAPQPVPITVPTPGPAPSKPPTT